MLEYMVLKRFQFHKGTIKTIKVMKHLLTIPYFNSIKVQLKQWFSYNWLSSSLYFNSIKVQLKQIKRTNPSFICLFQFHKGTIKTC